MTRLREYRRVVIVDVTHIGLIINSLIVFNNFNRLSQFPLLFVFLKTHDRRTVEVEKVPRLNAMLA
jgi:hypothetical protein